VINAIDADGTSQDLNQEGDRLVRSDLAFSAHRTLPFDVAKVFAWHERPGALSRLTPPWAQSEVLRRVGTIHDGNTTTLRVKAGPLHFEWEARHFDFVDGVVFKDEQVRGPFSKWIHEHRFSADEKGTLAEDRIDYRLPGGAVGEVLGRASVEKMLQRLFAHRYFTLFGDLSWHADYQGRPLRVLVAGSSGLVGRALCAFLSTGGHHVVRLVRRESRNSPDAVGDEVFWDPYTESIDMAAIGSVDAVINLAGENVADLRWTPERKAKLLSSRVEVTRYLATVASKLSPRPMVFINASAMGFYGERGDELIDETAPRGEGFLAEVCEAWEAATAPASEAGIRVVLPRISLVLTPQEGLLAKMLPAFRAGVGGRMGHGNQWMSWIALDDLVGVFHRSLFDTRYQGPINACTAEPVRNMTFTQRLGKALERPTFLPVPAIALKLALGEMGQVATSSTRMVPGQLVRLGFPYRFAKLDAAFMYLLGLTPPPKIICDDRLASVSYDTV
jgi:uncharacterized protein